MRALQQRCSKLEADLQSAESRAEASAAEHERRSLDGNADTLALSQQLEEERQRCIVLEEVDTWLSPILNGCTKV